MVSEISLKFTVDRIEEGYAVLLLRDEESTTVNWPLETIPFSVSEDVYKRQPYERLL